MNHPDRPPTKLNGVIPPTAVAVARVVPILKPVQVEKAVDGSEPAEPLPKGTVLP